MKAAFKKKIIFIKFTFICFLIYSQKILINGIPIIFGFYLLFFIINPFDFHY